MTTLEQRLILTRNRPAGFDWMRLLLATSIVLWHTIVTSYGLATQDAIWLNPMLRPLEAAVLGMFFALSGFLVAGSLERCRTIVSFAGLRIMRIFPALVVEVLLSAFVLGPLLTAFSLHEYFTGVSFRLYLLNMLGLVHFVLPGVFVGNPLPNIVNGQLWTVPYELICYEVLIIISLLSAYKRRSVLLMALVFCAILIISHECFSNCGFRGVLHGKNLVFCFLIGVGLFRFRDRVTWNGWIAAVSFVAAMTLLSLPGGDALAPLPLAYLTTYLGLCNPPRVKVLFSGDYSYGLFLYGFPIEQAVASTGPWAHHWYVGLAVSFPLTAAVAAGSWWLIEKPVVSRKAALLALESRVIAAAGYARGRFRRKTRPATAGGVIPSSSVPGCAQLADAAPGDTETPARS